MQEATETKATRRARPRRRKAPKAPASGVRKTELIGLTDDGRMVLWSTGDVLPISKFPLDGPWIKSAHYVINWKGHAITVHLGNMTDGNVSLQFMCSQKGMRSVSRNDIEPLLLGIVVPDPEIEANILRRLEELTEMFQKSLDTPHRQRGRLT